MNHPYSRGSCIDFDAVDRLCFAAVLRVPQSNLGFFNEMIMHIVLEKKWCSIVQVMGSTRENLHGHCPKRFKI